MKDELSVVSRQQTKSMNKPNSVWIIDESKYLSESECEILMNTVLSEMRKSDIPKFNKIRNWFMVELGLNTGLRVNEMVSLKHKDLFMENGKSSIKVIGKGNKLRSILINSEFKNTYTRYINLKKQFGYDIGSNSYLLNNPKGNKITKRALQKAFKILIIKSGLPRHYHIHCLRHTYTTFLLKASNNNYRFAQRQLGHASIKTTQTYAGVIESEGRKALENLYK